MTTTQQIQGEVTVMNSEHIETDCHQEEDCAAPLCPLHQEKLNDYIWYPDEEICRARKYQGLDWVKKQKLIARKYGSSDNFFNSKMLNAIGRVTISIVGANPDSPYLPLSERADEAWIRSRKPAREDKILAMTK